MFVHTGGAAKIRIQQGADNGKLLLHQCNKNVKYRRVQLLQAEIIIHM